MTTVRAVGRSVPAWTAWVNASMGVAVLQAEVSGGAVGGVGGGRDNHGGLLVEVVGADDRADGGGLAGAGVAFQGGPADRGAQALERGALLG